MASQSPRLLAAAAAVGVDLAVGVGAGAEAAGAVVPAPLHLRHQQPGHLRHHQYQLLRLHLGRVLQRPQRAGPEGALPRHLHAVQGLVAPRGLWRLHSQLKKAAILTMPRQGRFLLHFWPCYVINFHSGRFAFYCRIERFGLRLCLPICE